jgi:hypothetical protein
MPWLQILLILQVGGSPIGSHKVPETRILYWMLQSNSVDSVPGIHMERKG